MKNNNISKIVAIALFSTFFVFSSAIDQPHAAEHKAAEHKHMKHDKKKDMTEKAANLSSAEALKLLDDGIVMMALTMSDANRKEMFDDGPIMQKWHDHTVAIEDAIGALKTESLKKEAALQKRINGALNQLSKTLDDFHTATHDKNTDQALSEIKKANGALKLLKVYLK